jgi:prolyl-tRNA synthetase
MFSLWIKGEKDLPLKVYQSGTVWRYETKATRPLIRGREILWIETHCAFRNEKEARNQIKEDMEIAYNIVEKTFGIPFIFFQRPEWDKFAGAEETYAADTLMPDNRVLQILTTHLLGNKFAKPFDIKFMSQKKESYVWQTTCGPGMQRFLAALISWHGDKKGLFIPLELSPIQIIIVPIYKNENKDLVIEYCKKIEEKLKAHYRVAIDLTEDETPGYKFNKWEQKGVPIRIEIGEKEVRNNSITFILRKKKERKTLNIDEIEKIKAFYDEHFHELVKNNRRRIEEKIKTAKTFEEIGKYIKQGFVRVSFCSIKEDGKACYKKIKETYQAEVRGKRVDKEEKVGNNEKCIVCNKKANVIAYIAKQY